MKKALDVVKNVFTILIVIAAIGMMIFTIISVNTFDRTDRDLFGYKAFIVLSDSMSATDFSSGDLVLVKEVDPAGLREGDIISFSSQNTENFGEIVTHKIRSLTKDPRGNPAFITYGTTTGVDDTTPVTYPFVIGQYRSRIPKLGMFFSFLKTVPGYICCILVPFVVLIILQLINFIRIFRVYREEQMAGITKEREALEEERHKSEEMMKELLELKAKMEQQTSSAAAPEPEQQPEQ